jgi:hypothetical protein
MAGSRALSGCLRTAAAANGPRAKAPSPGQNKGRDRACATSESQLNKLRVSGGPEYIKLGRSVFYEIEALERWVEMHRRASTSDHGGR